LWGGSLTLDVNEQNGQARAFYEKLGFTVVGRSEFDGTGRPYPLLHLRREAPGDHVRWSCTPELGKGFRASCGDAPSVSTPLVHFHPLGNS
jgi:hypothetical protein